MADTLSNINSFLVSQANQPASTDQTDSVNHVAESVVIDSITRDYDEEIHFTNDKNTYAGVFSGTVEVKDSDGTLVNILDIVSQSSENVEETILSAKSDAISAAKEYTDSQLGNTESLEDQSKRIDQLSARTNTLSSNIQTNATNITTIGSNVNTINSTLRSHVNNTNVHVKKDRTLQEGLNAELLNGNTVSQILNTALFNTNNAINNITKIDCGEITAQN